jgi:hypothetical protein
LFPQRIKGAWFMSKAIPWIFQFEYQDWKRLCPSDKELPLTYEEWLDHSLEQESACAKSRVAVHRVFIPIADFQEYCLRHSCLPDGKSRAAFAKSKSGPEKK